MSKVTGATALGDEFGGATSGCALVDRLDNAQVPIHCVAQYAECFLICRTVVCGDRLCDAIELDKNGALVETVVIDLGGIPSRKYPRAGFLKRGSGELRICGESLWVVNRAIRGNPVRFGHGKMNVVVERDYARRDSAGTFAAAMSTDWAM